MAATFRLDTIQHAVTIATTLSKSWFRGHSRAVGELTPRIFRKEYQHEGYVAFRPNVELETIEEFKRHALTLSEGRVPAHDDRLGWLSLMQHYRTPTRLLDWTENALVALYFAVTADGSEDGELLGDVACCGIALGSV
jgi:hypothetical protein